MRMLFVAISLLLVSSSASARNLGALYQNFDTWMVARQNAVCPRHLTPTVCIKDHIRVRSMRGELLRQIKKTRTAVKANDINKVYDENTALENLILKLSKKIVRLIEEYPKP